MDLVRSRAAAAVLGVPPEVRRCLPDGRSEHMRPLAGAARMYPETDVPPVRLDGAYLSQVQSRLPPTLEERAAHLASRFGLPHDQAVRLVDNERDGLFARLASPEGEPSPRFVAGVLLTEVPAVEGEIKGPVPDAHIEEAFRGLSGGRYAKEALPEVIRALAAGRNLEEAVAELGLGPLSQAELEAVVDRAVAERAAFVRERGESAFGPLMGPVMAEVRGKADGRLVAAVLRARIAKELRGAR